MGGVQKTRSPQSSLRSRLPPVLGGHAASAPASAMILPEASPHPSALSQDHLVDDKMASPGQSSEGRAFTPTPLRTPTHSKGPGTADTLPRTLAEGPGCSLPARQQGWEGARRGRLPSAQRHICPGEEGGPESRASVFLLRGVRGHLCRLELVWGNRDP